MKSRNALAIFLFAAATSFGKETSSPSQQFLSKNHQAFDKLLEHPGGLDSQGRLDEGVVLDQKLIERVHSRISDNDKRRLSMPLDAESVKKGNLGALSVGAQFYELVVRQSDPERATIETIDPDSGAVITMHIRLLKYSSGHSSDNRLCGDVIVVRSGRFFVIELENELVAGDEPQLKWNDGTLPPKANEIWRQDAPQSDVPDASKHSLFATNLHTHGLHVFPGGFSDNVDLICNPRPNKLAPPTELPLLYYIRPDHIAGTFWYHPHLHGGVAYQMANGMAGALIVQAKPNDRFFDLDDIPEVAAANVPIKTISGAELKIGRVLLFQQFVLTETKENGKSVWIVDPKEVNDRRELDPANPSNPVPVGGPVDVTTVNGGQPINVQMRPGEVERWRLIHAGKEANIQLKWLKVENGNVLEPDDKELKVIRIAEDGIPCLDTDSTGAFVNHAVSSANAALNMYPGYRSDLLIQPLKPGEYFLIQEETTRLTSRRLRKKRVVPQFLARLAVQGNSAPMKLPQLSDIARCVPPDIVLPTPPDNNRPDQTVAFEFVDTEQFGVNGVPWAAGATPIEQTLGKAERWKLKINVPAEIPAGGIEPAKPTDEDLNASPDVKHPFHIHVNPFQVENYPAAGKMMWKDTFAFSKNDGDIFIRIQANDITGKSVLHCHILDHEDQGMMRRIRIKSPVISAELFPVLKPRRAPDALFAKGQLHVVVIFSGPACEACNRSLRQLQEAAREFVKLGAKVTAISREKLNVPFNLVGVTTFDMDKGGKTLDSLLGTAYIPTHATYLVDRSGNVRFEYIGAHPLSDFAELLNRVKELSFE